MATPFVSSLSLRLPAKRCSFRQQPAGPLLLFRTLSLRLPVERCSLSSSLQVRTPLFRASSLRLPVKQADSSHRLRSRRPAALDSIKFGAKIWHSTAELLRALFLSSSPSVKPPKRQISCCQRVASRRQNYTQECYRQFLSFSRCL